MYPKLCLPNCFLTDILSKVIGKYRGATRSIRVCVNAKLCNKQISTPTSSVGAGCSTTVIIKILNNPNKSRNPTDFLKFNHSSIQYKSLAVCRCAYKYAIILNNMHQLNLSSMPSFSVLLTFFLFLFSIQQPLKLSYATGSQSMPSCHLRGQRKVIYLRMYAHTNAPHNHSKCTLH